MFDAQCGLQPYFTSYSALPLTSAWTHSKENHTTQPAQRLHWKVHHRHAEDREDATSTDARITQFELSLMKMCLKVGFLVKYMLPTTKLRMAV
jgi:hypothetical protein